MLVVGGGGLGSEVAKNVVLAGVKSLTLLDPAPLQSHDVGCRFLANNDGESVMAVGLSCYVVMMSWLLQRALQAVPKLQVLNPNVMVTADLGDPTEKNDGYYQQFDVICATCCSTDTLVRIYTLDYIVTCVWVEPL